MTVACFWFFIHVESAMIPIFDDALRDNTDSVNMKMLMGVTRNGTLLALQHFLDLPKIERKVMSHADASPRFSCKTEVVVCCSRNLSRGRIHASRLYCNLMRAISRFTGASTSAEKFCRSYICRCILAAAERPSAKPTIPLPPL